MKRKLGTLVLFVLLALTAVALKHIEMPAAVSAKSIAQKAQ